MPRKDPNKPKAPKNAYQYFMDKLRLENNAKDESEKKDFASLSKAGSDEWKALSEEDRSPYNQKSDKDKRRYHKEMESYVPPSDSDSDEDRPKKKKKKQYKDPNAPKKPQSAYFQFSNVNRQKVKEELSAEKHDVKITDVATRLGEKWRNLTDKDKEPYEEMAAKDKTRYQREMEEYVASH